MEVFETSAINLSMKNSMGDQLMANVYTVEGIYDTEGRLKPLSIGQLVMAICLNRATELESIVVSLMETLARQSTNINALSKVQEKLLEMTGSDTYAGQTLSEKQSYYRVMSQALPDESKETSTILDGLGVAYKQTVDGKTVNMTYDDVIKAIDNKLNELNSISQETLIEIQSKTSKRDDTYNMVTNILKSLNTTLIGNANNL